jgi:quercetin dioxygenase-like cupin family protein
MTEKTYQMKPSPAVFDGHWADVILYRDDAAILHEFLPKGAEVSPHSVPHTVFIVILKGAVHVASGSLSYTRYPAGTVVEIPPGDIAGVRNEGDETAEFFVLKAAVYCK